MVKFSDLKRICGGENILFTEDQFLTAIVIDSRKAIASKGALFFALTGPRHDGHRYLAVLYAAGFRQFVVDRQIDVSVFAGSNIIRVPSVLEALQQLVAAHRDQFTLPVIGITGSNAKTIVKEWLYQLLAPDLSVVKNPGSYNSQTGVPLSVWQLNAHHQVGIFEAGISLPDEMQRLQKIIKPTIGIFTNLGPAHAEGFSSPAQKTREKILLFIVVFVVLGCVIEVAQWTSRKSMIMHNSDSKIRTTNNLTKKLHSAVCCWGLPFHEV